ncbi:NUDIX hydrolase [Exiguobacterium acetylicum]|jgi:ADP-ribose pyrophosphatase YjhB (NUDIX family)|uniref:NUDIX hydrolase n=1 Tax=Exiguobacterium TaxID=33986 RepID=UPI0004455EB9|nr:MULTISPECIES: NUDIX hydrolase [Exiguobacterium]EZP59206.1 DNA mismatch repair protein MutT [Exiguobacterium sp. RIT341]KQS37674.1 DNA mismatch repair protein MutT [Exiguobacterium sp. Leaf196]MDQ6468116.1 NUDIX hydrolase [Exiguobacterium acetylicum]HAB34541.1 NUDIX domain-containing protein [Exiguobacterium sp.]HBF58118.1 NUDIX domain-containing protein [Exiguobacterium sp.]
MNYVEQLRRKIGHDPVILVGSVVLVVQHEHILLEQRNEAQARFGLPGGLMEWAESPEETARRELLEETGLEVERLTLLDVYSGPQYVTTLANGDVFQSVTLAYIGEHPIGTLKQSDESIKLQFVSLDDLPDHLVGSHARMIEDYKKRR